MSLELWWRLIIEYAQTVEAHQVRVEGNKLGVAAHIQESDLE